MNLLAFDYAGHDFVLRVDVEQQLAYLMVNDVEVSVKPLDIISIHEFEHPTLGTLAVDVAFDFVDGKATYQLRRRGLVVAQGLADMDATASAALAKTKVFLSAMEPQVGTQSKSLSGKSGMVLLGIGLKLLKTVKVIKVALAATTIAVYSVMFTFEFAMALVGVLVFHEYGHLRAMKKFGIPTKGMYLIPFFGGIALGDKPRTQWEDVYISMMGPVFGLLMTAIFYVIYLITDSHFCGLVTSTSALLNLFNLFPIYPLDGGRVVKSLVFSRRNNIAMVLLLMISALCLVLTWKSGLIFLTFFIALGVFDLISSWKVPLAEDITPLKTYGIWFCLAWYLLIALAFLAMILMIAGAGVPGSEIAVKILNS
jgi:putative peptide zinc metalloprotease protein